jgi:hypothetical protein
MANRSEIRFAALALFVLAAPSLCLAANTCPWLTEATAGGLLGGDATGAFTEAAGGQPAVCLFTSDAPGGKRTLRITVEVTAEAAARLTTEEKNCGPDAAAIKAIGNEAETCTADDRKGAPGERVVGRVRDQLFIITLSSTLKGDPVLTRDALKAKIYTAAEQVAGNLF